jgi:uncharacterized Tic20 family protein
MTAESINTVVFEPTSDEKTWATLAHLSVLVNLVTGILGPAVALVIYLAHKDKSRYVAYQGGGALIAVAWIVTGLLSIVIIGLCLIPFAIVLSMLPVIAPIYGVVAAVKTSQGDDFRYWLIGDWVRSTYTG